MIILMSRSLKTDDRIRLRLSALQDKENELAEAFKKMFEPSLLSFRLQTLVPALLGSLNLGSKKRVERSLAVVNKIGKVRAL
jgi:hypothetical protein